MQIFFSCRSPFQVQRRSLVAAMILAAAPCLSGTPLAAEFYQDRIFRQKYELPDNVRSADVPAMLALLGLTLASQAPNAEPFSNKLAEAMGGQCDAAFAGRVAKFEPATDAQVAIAEQARASDEQVPSASDIEGLKCSLQLLLFQLADMDPNVSDAQLADLAAATERRFSRNWLPLNMVRWPEMTVAARRYLTLFRRANLLHAAGASLPMEWRPWLEAGNAKERMLALLKPEPYDTLERQLTALEGEWLARVRAARQPPQEPLAPVDPALSPGQAVTPDAIDAATDQQFAPPPVRSEGVPAAARAAARCEPGGICVAAEKTVFCRTPPQLTAILSQRPGPDRRRVLDAFKASGDCALVEAGQRLHWRGAMVTIMPRGEPAADLIPAVSADGRTGYALRDAMAADSAAAQ